MSHAEKTTKHHTQQRGEKELKVVGRNVWPLQQQQQIINTNLNGKKKYNFCFLRVCLTVYG